MILQTLSKVESDPLPYRKDIREIALSKRNPLLRTFALLLLVQLGDKEELVFEKGGKSFKVIPSQLEKPFYGERYKAFYDLLLSVSKNTSINNASRSLFDNYVLSLYPEKIFKGDLYLLAAAFNDLASRYLKSDSESDGFLFAHHLLGEDIEEKANQIEAAINALPEIE